MSEKVSMVLIVCLISLIAWSIYLGTNSNTDQIRKEILTGQVICKFTGFDEVNEPVFKCKTKKEIEEVLNFISTGGSNGR